MGKSIQKVMTPGVIGLGLTRPVMESLFRKAEELRSASPFLTLEPQGNIITIGDGNGKTLGTLVACLPEKVWIIFDDYGDRWVATALLPKEYGCLIHRRMAVSWNEGVKSNDEKSDSMARWKIAVA